MDASRDSSQADDPGLPSDRSFGFVFAAFFLLVSIVPVLFGGRLHGWALGVSGVFALLALTVPKVLAPLNRVWMRLGLLLHKLVSPIALGVIFYGTILPVSLVFRLLGKDPLRLRWDTKQSSYWIPKNAADSRRDFMKDQF